MFASPASRRVDQLERTERRVVVALEVVLDGVCAGRNVGAHGQLDVLVVVVADEQLVANVTE